MREENHSSFDLAALKAAVSRAAELGAYDAPPADFDDYESFARAVAVMRRASYGKLAEAVYGGARSQRFVVGTTSGTSAAPQLTLSPAGVKAGKHGAGDVDLVRRLRASGIFPAGGVAANLFSVDQFSTLHQGAGRILEACGVDVVPMGRLETGTRGQTQIEILAKLGVDTLFGTPGSLIQFAHLLQASPVKPTIKAVLFTGEGLGPAKRAWLTAAFGPQARLYGLYGFSEAGFVGLDLDSTETYEVRQSAFFVESDPVEGLLITSLDESAAVPLVRYAVGDSARLTRAGERCLLGDLRRKGFEFNYMGNLVSYDELKDLAAEEIGHRDFTLQIELVPGERGRDVLIAHILGAGVPGSLGEMVHAAFSETPKLREGYEKDAGRIEVRFEPWSAAALSARQKQTPIIDRRLGVA